MYTEVRSATNMCKLDNGKIIQYTSCHVANKIPTLTKKYYDILNFIGEGVIYSIDGVLQNCKEKLYFYV